MLRGTQLALTILLESVEINVNNKLPSRTATPLVCAIQQGKDARIDMLLRDERVQVSTSTEPEILNEFPDTFWLVNSPLKAAIYLSLIHI